jgi:hypothetical protein
MTKILFSDIEIYTLSRPISGNNSVMEYILNKEITMPNNSHFQLAGI